MENDVLPGMQKGDDEMKIYLTKYVLSYGILEAEGTESKSIPGAVSVTHIDHPKWGDDNPYLIVLKNEWKRTKEEARFQAQIKKLDRIASLRRQIKKLERMVFFG